MAAVSSPHVGIREWDNAHGIHIFQLHYSADTEKGTGEKVFVPELNMEISPWALQQYNAMTDKAMYRQEYEIDFSAKLGTLLFQFTEEATVERSFPIPADWTRYYGLDPHPVVPHASLWLAIDPWGDAWLYRELWPSRAYGLAGNVPEDDNRYTITDYCKTVKWLESASNPENQGKAEKIFNRIIDYAARTFGQGMDDDNPELNFQTRFEQNGVGPFKDAIKDHDTGISCVNEWLKPRDVEQQDGTFKPKSRLHIMDCCVETVYQLKTNRYQQLTPLLAQRQDPIGKPVAKRNHCTDILRYLLMSNPVYVSPTGPRSSWKPLYPGLNY